MDAAENIRNNLIDKLLTISNVDLLNALDKLVETTVGDSQVMLTEEQQQMLQMSEEDIAQGKWITQEEMDREDLEWLEEQ